MTPFRDDAELIAELRALRPAPAPAFAAELDEQAAAGFPRRSPLDDSAFGELLERLRRMSPGQMLLSAGATALAALAVATVVVVGTEPGGGGPGPLTRGASGGSSASRGFFNAPKPASPAQLDKQQVHKQQVQSYGLKAQAGAPAASAASGAEAETATNAPGPFAANASHRDVERSAEVVLGADPADVAGDAAAVFDAVHASGGIVLRSSTRQGPAGKAGAEFDLLIPSAKLSDALAAFSGIDEVRSRREATADITAPTIHVSERLQDSRARTDSLLEQLAAAESEAEREIVEAELGAERHRTASLQARLAHLHRRTSFSRVSLRIETGGASSSGEGGAWGIGDAFHDAGHILAIAAAVALVTLAVLLPIALIAALAWLAHRTWLRRGRERALG